VKELIVSIMIFFTILLISLFVHFFNYGGYNNKMINNQSEKIIKESHLHPSPKGLGVLFQSSQR